MDGSRVFQAAREGQLGYSERPGELVQSSASATISPRCLARALISQRGLHQEAFTTFLTDKPNQKAGPTALLDCNGEGDPSGGQSRALQFNSSPVQVLETHSSRPSPAA